MQPGEEQGNVNMKERRRQKQRNVSQHHEGGHVSTAESPEQQKREFERNVQEKYGGQHESVRPQSEDHAGSGSRVCLMSGR